MKQDKIDDKNKIVCMPENFNDDIFVAKTVDVKINYSKIYKKPNFFVRSFRYFVQKCFAMPLLWFYDKFFLGVKVKGKKNLKGLKGGAISVCNHVHYLDWSICPVFLSKHKSVAVVTLKDNFRIPFVRRLLKLYGCIPLAETHSDNVLFYKCLQNNLKSGKIIHLFPEASFWPYYNKIRPFKRGAFFFAVKYDVPIIPFIITFRYPKCKILRNKPKLTVVVGEILFANKELNAKEQISDLQERTQKELEKLLQQNPSVEYYKYVNEDEYKNTKLKINDKKLK